MELPENLLEAFEQVKREDFVPDRFVGYEYEDIDLPTEDQSTISQPSTIAFMLKLLDSKQGQKILEIGSGSGYTLALLSKTIKNGNIIGIERLKKLAIQSKQILSGDSNIEIINKDGFHGFPEQSPYDRIIVSGAYEEVPYFLLEQLSPSGILVVPVRQSIFQLIKNNGEVLEKEFPGFAFVPMIPENQE